MFHRGFKHSKTIKALGLRPRAFIDFLVFETPMKHKTRGFEVLFQIVFSTHAVLKFGEYHSDIQAGDFLRPMYPT